MEISTVIIFSLLAEAFELLWQYSSTIKGSIEKSFKIYRKSIFLFLAFHTGYMYIIFISLKFESLNFPIVLAIFLKAFDIFSKVELIKKIYIRKERFEDGLKMLLREKVPFSLYLISLLIYPYLIYLGIS
jgi:hypothetical protein